MEITSWIIDPPRRPWHWLGPLFDPWLWLALVVAGLALYATFVPKV
jgi:hypothetical protein